MSYQRGFVAELPATSYLPGVFDGYVLPVGMTMWPIPQIGAKGERLAIYEGSYDNRDLRADGNGAAFGAALLKNNRLMPSPYFVPDFGTLQNSGAPHGPDFESGEMDFEVR